MYIAVIGFRRISDFVTWCKSKNLTRVYNYNQIYRDKKNNEYYGILEYRDLTGREFDDYIEVDYLKEELLRRIRRK